MGRRNSGPILLDLAYHTLFYAHLYLQFRQEEFVPWERHRDGDERERRGAEPYSQAEALAYWTMVDAMVDLQVERMDLDSSESGFGWYDLPKLDHLILNIRHVQEHAGALRDRLLEAGIDQEWISKR